MNKVLFDAQCKEYVVWFLKNFILQEQSLDDILADGIDIEWFDNVCVGDALGAHIDEHPSVLRDFLPIEYIQQCDLDTFYDFRNEDVGIDLQWMSNISTRDAFRMHISSRVNAHCDSLKTA